MRRGRPAPERVRMRVLRALVLTGAGVGLGAVAHSHAGAVRLSAGSVLALLGLFALSWVAGARRLTWPVIATILGLGQLLTHVALSAGHAVAHDHGSGAVALPAVAPLDGGMVLLHTLAWAALTLVFTIGERALWRSVARLLTPWTLPAMPALGPRPPVVAHVVPVSGLAHRAVLGRAPPLR